MPHFLIRICLNLCILLLGIFVAQSFWYKDLNLICVDNLFLILRLLICMRWHGLQFVTTLLFAKKPCLFWSIIFNFGPFYLPLCSVYVIKICILLSFLYLGTTSLLRIFKILVQNLGHHLLWLQKKLSIKLSCIWVLIVILVGIFMFKNIKLGLWFLGKTAHVLHKILFATRKSNCKGNSCA